MTIDLLHETVRIRLDLSDQRFRHGRVLPRVSGTWDRADRASSGVMETHGREPAQYNPQVNAQVVGLRQHCRTDRGLC